MDIGKAFAFDSEDFAILCAFGNCDAARFRMQSGHFFFASQRGFGEADGQIENDIVAFALKMLMRLDSDENIQIS